MAGTLDLVHLQGFEKQGDGDKYSEFDVRVGVNQGSVINLLHIVIV